MSKRKDGTYTGNKLINIRLHRSLTGQIKTSSRIRKVSVSEYIRSAITKQLERDNRAK